MTEGVAKYLVCISCSLGRNLAETDTKLKSLLNYVERQLFRTNGSIGRVTTDFRVRPENPLEVTVEERLRYSLPELLANFGGMVGITGKRAVRVCSERFSEQEMGMPAVLHVRNWFTILYNAQNLC